MGEQLQNLRTVLMCTLMDSYRTAQNRHSINFFSSHIDNYTFRIGSRIFHRVDNTQPALSYVNTLVAMNRFNRNRGNTVTSKNYGRERNVHVFNFERVIGIVRHIPEWILAKGNCCVWNCSSRMILSL